MEKRIVLTGGPGSGKTTVLNNIVKIFSNQGVKVIVVSETATELINAGIKCFGDDNIDLIDFQELVMRLQLSKENIYDMSVEMYKRQHPNQDILIIYDRGTIDNKAYINESEFSEVLSRLNNAKSYFELLNKYDLVIDLVGAKEFYTLENNSARSENVDEALSLGVTTLKSWIGHPKIKIVLPKEKIEEKVQETVNYINEIMAKTQIKKQKKYLVDLNNSDLTYIMNNSRSVYIEQSYLMSSDDVEKRIRKMKIGDNVSYELTVYKKMDNGDRILESSKNISLKMYNELLEFIKPGTKTINKIRRYFNHNGQYMYLDIFYDDMCNQENVGYLEINVADEKLIDIPAYLSIIDDVSLDDGFSNINKAVIDKNLVTKKKDYQF